MVECSSEVAGKCDWRWVNETNRIYSLFGAQRTFQNPHSVPTSLYIGSVLDQCIVLSLVCFSNRNTAEL